MHCMSVLNNNQVPEDPKVQDHNAMQHALQIIIRACAEYVLDMCDAPGGPPVDDIDNILRHSARNIDFDYLVHFLFDGGFLMLQFKQAVRANRADRLDICWREFLSIGRTSAAHKTKCVPAKCLSMPASLP